MKRHIGVTLIELMIVVAVIGILAAIAYPSYREQVRRSNRSEAKIALEQTAIALERCFTRYMNYGSANCPAAAQFNSGGGFNTPNNFYRVTGNVATSTFTLTATPQAAQGADAQCMNLTLTETGARGISGSGAIRDCW